MSDVVKWRWEEPACCALVGLQICSWYGLHGQGSQYPNVHLHCGRFRARRNLLYTGASRAMRRLKISGIESERDLRIKMELHPKSILWKAKMGESVPAWRIEEAQRMLPQC